MRNRNPTSIPHCQIGTRCGLADTAVRLKVCLWSVIRTDSQILERTVKEFWKLSAFTSWSLRNWKNVWCKIWIFCAKRVNFILWNFHFSPQLGFLIDWFLFFLPHVFKYCIEMRSLPTSILLISPLRKVLTVQKILCLQPTVHSVHVSVLIPPDSRPDFRLYLHYSYWRLGPGYRSITQRLAGRPIQQ